MTVVFSKKGAKVDDAVMSGASVSTMLMNVLPSAPAHVASVPGGKPAFLNTSSAWRAFSTPGASLLITMYFTVVSSPEHGAARLGEVDEAMSASVGVPLSHPVDEVSMSPRLRDPR